MYHSGVMVEEERGGARRPGLLARLADKERWPRRWWWPHVDPLEVTGGIEQHHRETSETIRRTMLTLIASASSAP